MKRKDQPVIYYIRPLYQWIIRPDLLFRPKKVYSLDQLDDELKFKRTKASSRSGEPIHSFWQRLVNHGDIEPEGWVSVVGYSDSSTEELWVAAMRKLKKNEKVV